MIFLRFSKNQSTIGFKDLSISYAVLINASIPVTWFDAKQRAPYYILFFVWVFTTFLIDILYTSNLLSNLVKVEYEKLPETFQVRNIYFCTRKLFTVEFHRI